MREFRLSLAMAAAMVFASSLAAPSEAVATACVRVTLPNGAEHLECLSAPGAPYAVLQFSAVSGTKLRPTA